MTLFLTGSPTRYGEDRFTKENGFLDNVKAVLPPVSRILMVSAAPDDPGFTKYVKESMTECIDKSGIRHSSVTMLDRSNAADVERLVGESDWVILCGGHVPTQNAFIREIGLGAILRRYDGVIMGCSAGSMNCADRVYSHPEHPGESIDPLYRRWLPGLGLTNIRLIPHLEQVRNYWQDGRRLFEDIVFPDSHGDRFLTFRDGGYIMIKDGRATLYGEAWEISGGSMRRISEENKTSALMNAVFISPHFPETYWHFTASLRANGVSVFGIADTPYEHLPQELRDSLTDYYKVNDLENYDEVYRAVAWFAHKYGKIDWIESNNEYWLEQDARLRTDFNVTTGIRLDHIAAIKNKSEMKKYYALGGIPTARQIKGSEGEKAIRAFVAKTGWPVIAKPDNGVGAEGTFKLSSEAELDAWLRDHEHNVGAFVIEEFITGLLMSYDAVYNSASEPIFESNGVYPTPIMNVVNENLDVCYYVEKKCPKALAEIGRRTVKAFGIKSRFVHLEFFRLDRDREGLGKKGDYVGLEVNMRPAGGFTPDMMNFAHSTDVYQIWADMVAFDERRKGEGEQYYCGYAGRRDEHSYAHSHEEVMERYSGVLTMVRRMPDALAGALCNQAYIGRFSTKAEMQEFFDFTVARK